MSQIDLVPTLLDLLGTLYPTISTAKWRDSGSRRQS